MRAFKPRVEIRPTPRDPSYTSGNATSGGAVAEVLSFFFRRDKEALRVETAGGGTSRLYDGTHWGFDVEAGAEIGRRMAPFFIERARRDGAHPSHEGFSDLTLPCSSSSEQGATGRTAA